MIRPVAETSAKSVPSGGPPLGAGRCLTLGVRAAGLRCLVVGGGRVGTRKALKLAGAGATVSVLAPAISGRLRRAVGQGRIRWRRTDYEPSDLTAFNLVVAATSDAALNLRIGRQCEGRGLLCCVASSARSTRVIFPADHDDGEIALAVHTHGRDCRLARQLRDAIVACLRGEMTAVGTGKVYLVGAGPGSPDLISVRGCRVLRSADAVLIDRLLPREFLDELGIPSAGKTICRLGDERPRWSQAEINRWLVSHAWAGRVVVRLKGGDPFIFGRGDAEIDCLDEQGVSWEVIPGVSSAIAVPTAAGFPLTRHGRARSFAVATARVAGGEMARSFPRADSLVILMGAGTLGAIVDQLLADGWAADAPAAVVERGTLPWERQVEARLSQLARAAEDARVGPPATVVVGCAAAAVGEGRPRIVFTGREPAKFRSLGRVLHWPALGSSTKGRLAGPHSELGRPLPPHDVIYFTSAGGARAYRTVYGPDAFRREVWCLDATTQEALGEWDIKAIVVPPEKRGAGPILFGSIIA